MNMPFYVAPEQVMKDRADYARKGIARGRALVAVRYADGVAMVAETSSSTLRKISEIYDRIAFAGVGRYNEFDQLRVAGVRAADLKGFQYSRDDVDARSLANQYAQILGQIFTHEMKPMEVEILVAEVGQTNAGDQLFHINYDGTVVDERDHTVLGGDSAAISTRLAEALSGAEFDHLDLAAATRAAVAALSGPDRTIPVDELEVAVLARGASRRCFRRVSDETMAGLLETPRADGDEAGITVTAIDLNSDVGESYGAWTIGDDAEILRVVTSANVACGFHGGDPSTLRTVCDTASSNGVRIGAQVGYPDLVGFGRRFLDMSESELRDAVLYQLGALDAFAQVAGSEVAYVKPHGALYHATIEGHVQARAVVAAAAEYDFSLAVLGAPGSALLVAAEQAELEAVPEAFVDRAYRPDGRLVPRGDPGALIVDPEVVAARAVRLAVERTVEATDGTSIAVHARSLCVHGDTPGAAELAASVRRALEGAGVAVEAFTA